ncbi:histidinol-phosphate transaminase [Listeria sp. FSL L7-1509]|uniref:Histidinol-phosphate aminotransferase n=1 Tax=Listeria immobilis TaxID=2713502 RepID=A0ABR6SU20_9LIST|nr:histidinol-phosphate transaminase [Listeria immobilis]MBC1482429.1 histidinol-phosphate transaminase [Listeria immobilis]MBC1506649.1 histidinol-phosphate transaminase [Listeria immobilis]MBC1508898.1 histidinol-phosphate transaminase [Listeria immobilis]MBC6302267.1 histidinol-phosphate transaminase [Listeria immobilis]MBC6311599.1 histidinol-phosphate transaminase [Listeria immobilis]
MKWKKSLTGLSSYKPGKREEEVMAELGLTKITKLSSNENPLGTSPKVAALQANSNVETEIYPDGWAANLRKEVADFYQLEEEELIFTAGVDELIELLTRVLLDNTTNTVMAAPTFVQYRQNAFIEGAEVREIPLLADGAHNLEGMLAAIDEKTTIVWVCNPNNPTGNYIELTDLQAFLAKVPSDVLVVLDEAYIEYVTPQPEKHEQWIRTYKNLIITRTFSKIYGLASARVGYGIADKEIINQLNIVRPPFNTTSMGQKLAIEAIKDQAFIEACRISNAKGIKQYEAFAKRFEKVKLYPANGNFVLIDLGIDAGAIFSYLEKNGYITRSGAALGFKEAVRITIGTEEENSAVIALLEKLL